ncbi:MAG TPA: bifunctional ornithine acetyltransferase/N-acetylglutamate synthase [Solirubrobacterales bacterium]|nr:bifunctional ornithine acetyltransferase/N-acetylglutamate synthase [Solirubrobacterales bacterium]
MTFFRSRWVDPPEGVEELDPAELAPGFRSAGIACGLKVGGGPDLGLVVCDSEARSSLLLTRNAAASAAVRVCRRECDGKRIRAAIVNSGNANAATGERGYRDALEMRAATANELRVDPRSVAVAQTGTIGIPLPTRQVVSGIAAAAARLDAWGGTRFAEAIMTTDRAPKHCTVRSGAVTLSVQAKGAGMMEPGFATMLCFAQTDAEVADPRATLRAAVGSSFERITVDGQMSTNDTVLFQATGAAGRPLPAGLLDAVLLQLALEIVADGEGATRTGRIEVSGAGSDQEAERVARAIANSPLVKAALYGRDPNWGRVAQAAGMALAGEELCDLGPERIEAAELSSDGAEAELALRLERGEAEARVYFSDLTPAYVRLNSEYTT